MRRSSVLIAVLLLSAVIENPAEAKWHKRRSWSTHSYKAPSVRSTMKSLSAKPKRSGGKPRKSRARASDVVLAEEARSIAAKDQAVSAKGGPAAEKVAGKRTGDLVAERRAKAANQAGRRPQSSTSFPWTEAPAPRQVSGISDGDRQAIAALK